MSAGYTALDFQVAALLTDKGETVKLSGAHVIDASQQLAGEVSKATQKEGSTTITLGYMSMTSIICTCPNGTL